MIRPAMELLGVGSRVIYRNPRSGAAHRASVLELNQLTGRVHIRYEVWTTPRRRPGRPVRAPIRQTVEASTTVSELFLTGLEPETS